MLTQCLKHAGSNRGDELTALESQFMTILHAHCGLGNAISVPAMASQLGISTRAAQDIKKTLVEEHGISIG
jgi:hypothetical protein